MTLSKRYTRTLQSMLVALFIPTTCFANQFLNPFAHDSKSMTVERVMDLNFVARIVAQDKSKKTPDSFDQQTIFSTRASILTPRSLKNSKNLIRKRAVVKALLENPSTTIGMPYLTSNLLDFHGGSGFYENNGAFTDLNFNFQEASVESFGDLGFYGPSEIPEAIKNIVANTQIMPKSSSGARKGGAGGLNSSGLGGGFGNSLPSMGTSYSGNRSAKSDDDEISPKKLISLGQNSPGNIMEPEFDKEDSDFPNVDRLIGGAPENNEFRKINSPDDVILPFSGPSIAPLAAALPVPTNNEPAAAVANQSVPEPSIFTLVIMGVLLLFLMEYISYEKRNKKV